MKYKALICDFDGTLITLKRHGNTLPSPSEKVTEAILKAHDKVVVGIATSRRHFELFDVFDRLKLTAPCITRGGVQIVDPVSKKVLYEKVLSLDKAKEIGLKAAEIGITMFIDSDDKITSFEPSMKISKPFGLFTTSLAAEKAEKLFQLLQTIPTIEVQKIPSHIQGELHITANSPEATKQHGILEVAKLLDIAPSEIIGVGDGYNDFPLLMACGLKVAMGNAVPELKEIADYIAPSVEEDGVADVIEKFVLNPMSSLV